MRQRLGENPSLAGQLPLPDSAPPQEQSFMAFPILRACHTPFSRHSDKAIHSAYSFREQTTVRSLALEPQGLEDP